jgi:hypothetical protein
VNECKYTYFHKPNFRPYINLLNFIIMPLREIINRNKNDIAFIIGNGINRYPDNPAAVSWDALLVKLWRKFAPGIFEGEEKPEGLTLTEFYDVLDLSSTGELLSGSAIQKEAVRILDDWNFSNHHKRITEKAREWNIPVLTTNFDRLMPLSVGLNKFYMDKKSFTDFYPWDIYYSDRELLSPADGFGIWFINGYVEYFRSIRLGLTHYMGCVERARKMLHKGEGNPFSGKNREHWAGRHTWLHILFNRDICIFGLSLGENEVFIRWLLIERARYFKKFPDREKKGWYISTVSKTPDKDSEGKKMFMRSVGIKIVEVENRDAIYRTPWG